MQFDGPRGYFVTPEEIQMMRELRAGGASINAIGRIMQRNRETVRTRLGLEPELLPRVPDEDAAKIRAEYEGLDKPSTRALADKWGWCPDAIISAIRRAGGTIRPNHRGRRLKLTACQVLALREGGMKPLEISVAYSIKHATVLGMLSRAKRDRARAGLL